MSFVPIPATRFYPRPGMDAALYHGTLPLITEGPARINGPRGVLDTATFEVLVDSALADEQLASLGFAYDTKVTTSDGFHSMWVKDMKEQVISPLVTQFTIEIIGLLKEGDKRLRRINPILATSYQGGGEAGGGGGGAAFVSTSKISDYTTFQIVDIYFQETVPDYTGIGRAATPPDAVGVPTIPRPGTVPTGYTVGWNLATRVAEHTYGDLYRVEDTYSYSQYKDI